VECLEDVEKVLRHGGKSRACAGTDLNARSSRSHCVVTIHVVGFNHIAEVKYMAKLNLVSKFTCLLHRFVFHEMRAFVLLGRPGWIGTDFEIRRNWGEVLNGSCFPHEVPVYQMNRSLVF
jgi:hypothetical protein